MTSRQPSTKSRSHRTTPATQPATRRRQPAPVEDYYEEPAYYDEQQYYREEPVEEIGPPTDHSGKIIMLQWIVIAVLVIGSALAGWLMVNKLTTTLTENTRLNGNASSLKEQLRQAKLQIPKTPTPTPVPTVEP